MIGEREIRDQPATHVGASELSCHLTAYIANICVNGRDGDIQIFRAGDRMICAGDCPPPPFLGRDARSAEKFNSSSRTSIVLNAQQQILWPLRRSLAARSETAPTLLGFYCLERTKICLSMKINVSSNPRSCNTGHSLPITWFRFWQTGGWPFRLRETERERKKKGGSQSNNNGTPDEKRW